MTKAFNFNNVAPKQLRMEALLQSGAGKNCFPIRPLQGEDASYKLHHAQELNIDFFFNGQTRQFFF